MPVTKDVFRPTISSDQIYALIDIMDAARSGEQFSGLNPVLKDYYDKLNVQAFKIGNGIARPAYQVTGVRKESAISVTALGGTDEDVASWEGKFNNNAAIDSATAAQLDWMIQCTQEESKNPPDISEFMKGGKYYEQWNQESKTEQAGTSGTGTHSTSSNGNSADDIGTHDFIVMPDEDNSADVELAAALFGKL
jgi:hypothetical protein